MEPRDRKILLVYEQPGKKAHSRKQQWRLPGGKCCNAEETACGCTEAPWETVIREVKEETGFDVEVIRKIRTYSQPDTGFVTNFMLVRIIGGYLTTRLFGRKKIETPRWFPITSLPENEKINPSHLQAIHRALERERQFLERFAQPTETQ